MTGMLRATVATGLTLLGVLTFSGGRCFAGPPTLGFRNDTKDAVVVQGLMIINNVLRRDKVHILQPGEVAYDAVLFPSNRLIIVADAKQPTRTLFQGTIPFARNDQFFSIQNDSPQGKGGKEAKGAMTRVKLTRDTPPGAPADDSNRPARGDRGSSSRPR